MQRRSTKKAKKLKRKISGPPPKCFLTIHFTRYFLDSLSHSYMEVIFKEIPKQFIKILDRLWSEGV